MAQDRTNEQSSPSKKHSEQNAIAEDVSPEEPRSSQRPGSARLVRLWNESRGPRPISQSLVPAPLSLSGLNSRSQTSEKQSSRPTPAQRIDTPGENSNVLSQGPAGPQRPVTPEQATASQGIPEVWTPIPKKKKKLQITTPTAVGHRYDFLLNNSWTGITSPTSSGPEVEPPAHTGPDVILQGTDPSPLARAHNAQVRIRRLLNALRCFHDSEPQFRRLAGSLMSPNELEVRPVLARFDANVRRVLAEYKSVIRTVLGEESAIVKLLWHFRRLHVKNSEAIAEGRPGAALMSAEDAKEEADALEREVDKAGYVLAEAKEGLQLLLRRLEAHNVDAVATLKELEEKEQ